MTMRWVFRAAVVGVTVATVLGSGAYSTQAGSTGTEPNTLLSVPRHVVHTVDADRECSTREPNRRSATPPARRRRFEFSVLGKGGLPTTGVATVSLNVTVANGENPHGRWRLRDGVPVRGSSRHVEPELRRQARRFRTR